MVRIITLFWGVSQKPWNPNHVVLAGITTQVTMLTGNEQSGDLSKRVCCFLKKTINVIRHKWKLELKNILHESVVLFLKGYTDESDVWQEKYEMPGLFEEMIGELYEEVKPMYEQLHAYVRRRLAQKYTEDKVDINGAIPAHLLGKLDKHNQSLSFSSLNFVRAYLWPAPS